MFTKFYLLVIALSALIFNKVNLTKVVIIFFVGLISRLTINNLYLVNVFIDYTNLISLIYYFSMSCFIVLVHDIVSYFHFSIFPSFIFTYCHSVWSCLIKYFTIFINLFSSSFCYLYNHFNLANTTHFKLRYLTTLYNHITYKPVIIMSSSDYPVSDSSNNNNQINAISSNSEKSIALFMNNPGSSSNSGNPAGSSHGGSQSLNKPDKCNLLYRCKRFIS